MVSMSGALIITAAVASVVPLDATAVVQSRQVVATTRSEWIKFNPVTPLTAATFATPPATDWPWVRLNMPASADPAEIKAEVQQMHDAGIAGIEVGQGAFPNNEQLVALLSAATQGGMKVSLSHGPTQNPAGYSTTATTPGRRCTSDAPWWMPGQRSMARCQPARRRSWGAAVSVAQADVDRGLVAAAPEQSRLARPPATLRRRPLLQAGPGRGWRRGGPQATRTTLIAVLAYRCIQNPCPATGPAELDRSSVVDLTSAVTGRNTAGVLGGTTAGSLRWTAASSPAGAQWQVLAFWTRGVFAQPDPFSPEGYQELVHSMETGLSAEVKELLRANRGDLFYDSHSSDRGSPDELWTNQMAEEFAKRRQYPLIPTSGALSRVL